jgi:hypothetical protein
MICPLLRLVAVVEQEQWEGEQEAVREGRSQASS